MRRCSGNNTEEWGFKAIFEKACTNCSIIVFSVNIVGQQYMILVDNQLRGYHEAS